MTYFLLTSQLPGSSWLGPFFSISSIPDDLNNSQPSVTQQCFTELDARRPADVNASISTLRMAGKHIQNELHAVVKVRGDSRMPSL